MISRSQGRSSWCKKGEEGAIAGLHYLQSRNFLILNPLSQGRFKVLSNFVADGPPGIFQLSGEVAHRRPNEHEFLRMVAALLHMVTRLDHEHWRLGFVVVPLGESRLARI
jgi:hypothetical protein